jgi:hypothetical protein
MTSSSLRRRQQQQQQQQRGVLRGYMALLLVEGVRGFAGRQPCE